MPTDTSTLVWRLGVMLYYLFTGNFPFRSKSIEKLKTKILSKTVEIPSKLSGPIQTILVKMFTKNPSMRIQLCEIQSFFSQIPINEDKKKAPIVRARTNIALTSSKTISRSSMNLRPVSITPRRQLQSTLDQGTLLNLERPQDIEDEGQKRKSRALFASRPNISMKRPRSSLKLK